MTTEKLTKIVKTRVTESFYEEQLQPHIKSQGDQSAFFREGLELAAALRSMPPAQKTLLLSIIQQSASKKAS